MTNNSCNTNISVVDNQILLPSQCGFSAYLSSTQSSVTGNGTAFTLIADTELFDIGDNYDNTTGVFTTPVSGIYSFTAVVAYVADSGNTGATVAAISLHGGPTTLYGSSFPGRKLLNTFYGADGIITYNFNFTHYLAAASNIYIVIQGYGGLKVDSVYGHATDVYTGFSGYLVG